MIGLLYQQSSYSWVVQMTVERRADLAAAYSAPTIFRYVRLVKHSQATDYGMPIVVLPNSLAMEEKRWN